MYEMQNIKIKIKIYQYILIFILIFFGIFGLAGNTKAADCTHYVSPIGTASWLGCAGPSPLNGISACSVQTAFENAEAGDVVCFRGGEQYNIPAHTSSDTYSGVYNFAHSGTGDSDAERIIFKAFPGEKPIFNGTMTGSGEGHCYATLFGTAGHDYITIDGFTFQTDSGLYQARVHIGSGNSDNHSQYVKIVNCIFNGGTNTCSNEDNNEAIRFDFTDNCTVSNSTIYNYRFTTLNGYRGIGAIKSYTGTYLTVENCEIYNCSHGIYGKSYNDHHIYRYNYIHDVGDGINYSANSHYATNANIYHNLITQFSYSGINIYGNGDDTVDGCSVYHNTLYSTIPSPREGPIVFYGFTGSNPYDSGSLYDNIIIGPPGADYNLTARLWYLSLSVCDYNNYGNVFSIYFGAGGQQSSLSNLQGISGNGLSVGMHDMNSIATDPIFVGGTTLTEAADFALSANSPGTPGHNPSSDGKDMGVDVSLVGPNADGSGEEDDITSPASPSGLNVI